MTSMDQELLQKLLTTFKVEAQDHISAIASGLAELEKSSSGERQMVLIESMFRESHSLKGAARAVNLIKIEAACQSLEGLFANLKSKPENLSPERVAQLYQMVDGLAGMLSGGNQEATSVGQGRPVEKKAPKGVGVAEPYDNAHESEVHQFEESVMSHPFRDEMPTMSETLRVPTSKLDALFRQTEELIPAKSMGAQRVSESREIERVLAEWEKEWRSVRSLVRALQHSQNGGHPRTHEPLHTGRPFDSARHNGKVLVFLEQNERRLADVRNKLAVLSGRLNSDWRELDRKIDDLVEEMKLVSMVPFSALLESFPRLVRDLCRECSKEAELIITGSEIETDRRVLEAMKDPLIHLVRNSIDHGIESAKLRIDRGKPPRAKLSISILPKDSDKVEILVSDDGTGIDIGKVQATLVRLGRVSAESVAKMDTQQIISSIFESGVSTSPIITDVSGRGLGLAIVREKAVKVGGTVVVETDPGVGTTFRLTLPLTLARFRGIVVGVGRQQFVIPTIHVRRVSRVSRADIKTVENRNTIHVDGRVTSAVRLADVLDIADRDRTVDPAHRIPLLVLAWGDEQIAFFVDDILNEQEVVVKGLGRQLRSVPNIAGATILGTGRVLPVLSVPDLIRSAISTAANPVPESQGLSKSVLVAEDSITARTLLRNILESAGYKVRTAADGAEALQLLAEEPFDLLVSDVDMPRMSGFDLTARIRTDRRLSRLPVVLVTALDSRQDRERGVDVGANAYIVKSSFDQGNLLEVVRRLI